MILNIDYAIVAAEIVAFITLFILTISLLFDKNKSASSTIFTKCVVVELLVLLLDIHCYVLEGNPYNTQFLYFTNLFVGIMGDCLLVYFSRYAWNIVNEKKKTNKSVVIIVIALCAIDTQFQIFGAITGFTFSIANSKLITTPYYDLTFIVMILGLLIIQAFLITKIKIIGSKMWLMFGLYYILPIISMIILMINSDLSFVSTSIAISFFVLYLGIEKTEKEKLLMEMLNKDSLTHLLNRRAFNQTINYYKKTNKPVVVIYSDLNNLKQINDSYGHEIGDEYIIKYSNKLLDEFDNDTIYRIGGDEFVIIADYSVNAFNSLIKKIMKISADGRESSYGYSFGLGCNIVDCINVADNYMQRNKTKYYVSNNIERRKGERRSNTDRRKKCE